MPSCMWATSLVLAFIKEVKFSIGSPLVCLRATAIAKWLSFAALLVQLEKEKIWGGGGERKKKEDTVSQERQ